MRVSTRNVSAVLAVCAVAVLCAARPVAAQGGVGFGVSAGLTRATFDFDGSSDLVEARANWGLREIIEGTSPTRSRSRPSRCRRS